MNSVYEIYQNTELYDLEFKDRDHEIPFFKKWAKSSHGPVLEVACGTGRITEPLAREGIDIIGSDLCETMINKARKNFPDLNLLVQDCREISFKQNFALIFSASNAMQHLLDHSSVLSFLRSAKEHLTPTGILIIDVFNPDPVKLSRDPEEVSLHKTFQDIQVYSSSSYDSKKQLLHFFLRYFRNKKEFHRKDISIRCFFPAELSFLIESAGLEITKRFGSYDEETFLSSSPQQILVCQRAN